MKRQLFEDVVRSCYLAASRSHSAFSSFVNEKNDGTPVSGVFVVRGEEETLAVMAAVEKIAESFDRR